MSFDGYELDENTFNNDTQGRPRFYGIYSAQVATGVDPTGKNRVKVKVFMPSGTEVSNWAKACLPITNSSYHPDHLPHTAAQVAALLTTVQTTVTSSSALSAGSAHTHTVTIPPLTVTPIDSTKQLTHQHVTAVKTKTVSKNNATIVADSPGNTTDSREKSKYTVASGLGVGTTAGTTGPLVPEHTFHASIPVEGQMIWVVFEAGLLEYPVWIGVQS